MENRLTEIDGLREDIKQLNNLIAFIFFFFMVFFGAIIYGMTQEQELVHKLVNEVYKYPRDKAF